MVQDPAAILDYTVDWSAWLGSDTISTSAWAIDSGLNGTSPSNTTKLASIFLSGGTAGVSYNVKNTITTAAGRTNAASFQMRIQRKVIGA